MAARRRSTTNNLEGALARERSAERIERVVAPRAVEHLWASHPGANDPTEMGTSGLVLGGFVQEERPKASEDDLKEQYEKDRKALSRQAGGAVGDRFAGKKGGLEEDEFGSRSVPRGKDCDLKVKWHSASRRRPVIRPAWARGPAWMVTGKIEITTSNPPVNLYILGAVYQEILGDDGKVKESHWVGLEPEIAGKLQAPEKSIEGSATIYNTDGQIQEAVREMHRQRGKPPKVKYYHAALLFVRDALPNFVFLGKVLGEVE